MNHSRTTATVQAGATAQFTATVSYDSASRGVIWTVSCSVASCGSVSPTSTVSGVPATHTAPSAPPGSNMAVAVVAAAVADPTKTRSASLPVPAISVSVSPGMAMATEQAGTTAQLAAAVSYDPSNSGLTWAVSCSAAPCGTVSLGSTPSGTATTYTAPTALPSSGMTITVTANSVADTSKSNSATLSPVGHIPGYDVGVDYHAFGTDNLSTAFVTICNQPTVRQTVQAQLQGMADRGATLARQMSQRPLSIPWESEFSSQTSFTQKILRKTSFVIPEVIDEILDDVEKFKKEHTDWSRSLQLPKPSGK